LVSFKRCFSGENGLKNNFSGKKTTPRFSKKEFGAIGDVSFIVVDDVLYVV
jgi:hypothetical protein